MPSFKEIVRIFIGICALATILLGGLFILFSAYYLGTDIQELFGDNTMGFEAVKFFLYIVGGLIIFVGLLQALLFKFDNKCFICLVTYYSSLVYTDCYSRIQYFYDSIYRNMVCSSGSKRCCE